MRVGVDRQKYFIQIPLPPKIDANVTMMTVEEKPDVTYRCGAVRAWWAWWCGGRGGHGVCAAAAAAAGGGEGAL